MRAVVLEEYRDRVEEAIGGLKVVQRQVPTVGPWRGLGQN